jgi:hypothetical protein
VERFPAHKRANMPMYSNNFLLGDKPDVISREKSTLNLIIARKNYSYKRSLTTDHLYMYPCMYLANGIRKYKDYIDMNMLLLS